MMLEDYLAYLPEPTEADLKRVFDATMTADLAGETSIPTHVAVTLLDAYLHTALKLKALEENT
jgi:hypothetical protein